MTRLRLIPLALAFAVLLPLLAVAAAMAESVNDEVA